MKINDTLKIFFYFKMDRNDIQMSDPKASITDLFALPAETKLQVTKKH